MTRQLEWKGLWNYAEHIHVQEARTAAGVARHLARSQEYWDKRHLVLRKMRSAAYPLLHQARSVAAIHLSVGVCMILRWIPTEEKPADGPSRRRAMAARGRGRRAPQFWSGRRCIDRGAARRRAVPNGALVIFVILPTINGAAWGARARTTRVLRLKRGPLAYEIAGREGRPPEDAPLRLAVHHMNDRTNREYLAEARSFVADVWTQRLPFSSPEVT